MIIKTKIVATVGPACWDLDDLTRLAKAGVDVFRLNFSHGSIKEHARALGYIRQISDRINAPLAVMADLCGPKIRVGKMRGSGADLKTGSEIIIQRKPVLGTKKRISTTLSELIDDVRRSQRILLDDGKIQLKVIDRRPPNEILCKVITGGVLTSGKGVNLPGTKLSSKIPTEKDLADLKWIAQNDIDYIAVSFVQRAADIRALQKVLKKTPSVAQIIAKIEKPQALKNIHSIIASADGVLVARGDLGVEMDLSEVPLAQKRLVRLCNKADKICIIATQMLETMTTSAVPTRAEVSDVANAVFDGADAVMLSGETAVGLNPERAVRMMDKITNRVERYLGETPEVTGAKTLPAAGPESLQSIARAVRTLVTNDSIKAVVAFTHTGATARCLSKMRLPVPILALSPNKHVLQQMCLLYGVEGKLAPLVEHTNEILSIATAEIRKLAWAKKGQKIVVVSGRPIGQAGRTNTLVVETV